MNSSPISRIRLSKQSLPERRGALRDRRILEATMKYQGQFMNVEVTDVSESGAYVVAPVLPEFADCVIISIGLPEFGASVMVSGRVRRVGIGSRSLHRPGGFGIQFTRYYTRSGYDSLMCHVTA